MDESSGRFAQNTEQNRAITQSLQALSRALDQRLERRRQLRQASIVVGAFLLGCASVAILHSLNRVRRRRQRHSVEPRGLDDRDCLIEP